MQRHRIELDREGVKALLQSEEVGQAVEETARPFAKTAGSNAAAAGQPDAEFDVRRFVGRDRQRVHIGTRNWAARVAEANARALTRAFGGRGE